MDPNIEGASKIIPVAIKNDGTISSSKSSTVSRQQFEELQKYALDLIKEISQEILSGNIELRPYYTVANQISACHYCPYNSICHFDSKLRNNNYRIIEPAKREDAIAKISEKVENKQ
jgi:ATP-dependent helicase/nuclease subunit B